ncbi:hypothetical protein BC936DRAFT_147403 [Jimgerdemannia flammicorona]|uniref:Uncharacterized protein n=1 Tax=Jimgerdemannia flammicorona TaxID=994334 RepID=A0A433D5D1_9FUNG|nr:hypothetical protein BC936DRAFT_147403 [Jimgerdemannia flammicorona]
MYAHRHPGSRLTGTKEAALICRAATERRGLEYECPVGNCSAPCIASLEFTTSLFVWKVEVGEANDALTEDHAFLKQL